MKPTTSARNAALSGWSNTAPNIPPPLATLSRMADGNNAEKVKGWQPAPNVAVTSDATCSTLTTTWPHGMTRIGASTRQKRSLALSRGSTLRMRRTRARNPGGQIHDNHGIGQHAEQPVNRTPVRLIHPVFMAYDDMHCPCGGTKMTETMLCLACEAHFADRDEMRIYRDETYSVDRRRSSAVALLSMARRRRRSEVRLNTP